MANPQIKAIITAEDRSTATLNKFEKNLKLAGIAIAGVAAAIGYKSVKAFASFEQKMSDVSTLVDTGAFNMDAFGKSILEMTKKVPRSADELGAAAYQIVSAGISDASDALKVLEKSAVLGVAGLGSTAEAADLTTSAINSFGYSAEDAEEVTNILFKTVKAGKTTVSELAQAFGMVAPLAAEAGVSFAELQGATAALTTAGLKTSVAQTQIRASLVALIKPTEDMKLLLGDYEGAGKDLIETSGGLVSAFTEIRRRAEEQGVSLSKAMGSVEGYNAVLSLTGATSEKFEKIMENMTDGVIEVSEAFDKQKKTLENQVQLIKNYGTVFMITIGKGITAALKVAITDTLKYGEATQEAARISLALYDATSYLIIAFKTIGTSIAWVIEKTNQAMWALKGLWATITKNKEGFEEARQQMDMSTLVMDELRGQVNSLATGYLNTRAELQKSLMSTSDLMKAQEEQLKLEKQLEDALGNSANAYGDVGEAAEEAKEQIKDYLKEIDKIFMQGVEARLSENEKYRKEAAEIVIEAEEKSSDIEKEMVDKKREYEIDKAKAVADSNNQQLRDLEDRYKEEIADLETQKADAESILYTANLHEKEFIGEIEELKKRNSMNELARLMYDHNKKIVAITEETQTEINAVKEKIQAAIKEGVAKRDEMKKTTDTNIELMGEVTAAHKNELDIQLANTKNNVAQTNAALEKLKPSPASLLTGFSSQIPSMFTTPWMAAEGGIVRKPTLAMIGESGPEAVVPLGKGLGGFNITITGNTFMSDEDAAIKIGDMIISELKLGNRL